MAPRRSAGTTAPRPVVVAFRSVADPPAEVALPAAPRAALPRAARPRRVVRAASSRAAIGTQTASGGRDPGRPRSSPPHVRHTHTVTLGT